MGRAEDIFEKIRREGFKAIDEFIITRKYEELFLDFKRSADRGAGKFLHSSDRENLAKAISGFGNSEGGVIVWGVDCARTKEGADVAGSRFPILDTKKYASWIEGAISSCTVPPHVGIQSHIVNIEDTDEGYVVTYIPRSDNAPHQVVLNGKYQYQYFIRAGSSFVHIPHAVLAGLFGRRPQPNVFPMFTVGPARIEAERGDAIGMQIGILLSNKGPGVASDLFINVVIINSPGDSCILSIEPIKSNKWDGHFAFSRILHMMSEAGVRLAPEAFYQPCVINLSLKPPYQKDLDIQINCGCGQSPAYKLKIGNKKEIIESLCNDFMAKITNRTIKEKDRHALTTGVFAIGKDKINSEI